MIKIPPILIALSILLTTAGCKKSNSGVDITGGLVTINSGHADSTNFIITRGVLNDNHGNTGYTTSINSADSFSIFIIGQLRKGSNTVSVSTLEVNITTRNNNSPTEIDSAFNNNAGTILLTDSTLIFNLQITSAYPVNTYPFTGTVKY